MRSHSRAKGVAGPRSRFDRALAITLVSGMGLLMILGLVFSIAHGSQQITTRATQLHNADETLRSATVVRAQSGLAVHFTIIDSTYGANSEEAISVSMSEARTALQEMHEGVAGLVTDGMDHAGAAIAASSDFATITNLLLAAVSDGDADSAEALSDAQDGAFRELVGNLEAVRDGLRSAVFQSDVFLGRVGSITRFLVAFLVPAAVIFIYRELLLRQHRQNELEGRLESERRLSRAREEFIANASHELRTPLTGISGLAQILAEDPSIADSESASELLHLIISESSDLARMVEDLLTTARLDAGALHFDIVDLPVADLVGDVVDPLVRGGAHITLDCFPAGVRGDSLRTRQVLRNLLSNAQKYGGPNIEIKGTVERRTYLFEIIDDGAGVPEHISDRVFERFVHRGNAGSTDSVGLGLAIVHALVQGMGGSVRYERRDDRTVFSVRLPLADDLSRFDSDVADQAAMAPAGQSAGADG